MAHVLYYSSLCPDTPPFVEALKERNISYEAVDITESMKNLKRFLQLRDERAEFNERKKWGFVGVPVLVTENNQFIFDFNDILGTTCTPPVI
ncbi:glutaredoxin [Carnobacteriaceae bacterium zg-ZUI78]|uniref:glutaredoxin domain-containing protein n=1 Tax=Granulicatella sp. zg-84 TaxID=2678503 RepID=UPI0013C1BBC9|nr:glutaredoxin domain-containing protein [Granulicatella sp. zg-84]MBS4750479.1 glutaredoxin [Carnobacteriaceae bacterium zg-ZUI78]NEW66126.1 glutaredoxin [Granulicatella sp. zg-84]QMI85434.1 glutaredoxin [Carnobacteriaceae bacterium zg-84]